MVGGKSKRQHIYLLRAALAGSRWRIETKRGIGWRLLSAADEP